MNGKIIELEIVKLSRQGDGIGYFQGEIIYVPFAMQGDVVKVALGVLRKGAYQGKLLEIVQSSSQRVVAPCQYFTECGGCNLQHLSENAYFEFKHKMIIDLLGKFSLPKDLASKTEIIGRNSRRRASFKVSYLNKQLSFGFFSARSHQIINIKSCLLLTGSLQELLLNLRKFLPKLISVQEISAIDATHLGDKLEISLAVQNHISNKDRASLQIFAKEHNIARISIYYENNKHDFELIAGEELLELDLGDQLRVKLPVNSFMQASQQGEMAIKKFILAEISGGENIADLYCGYGSYSFALAQLANKIFAYEGNAEMITAMKNAVRTANLGQKIFCQQQDLYKNPIRNLNNFTTIIINPPRNGAGPQIKQISRFFKGKLIMVSCNITSFTRDLKILLEAGFKLQKIQGIDQFYWSKHIEIIALFSKD